MKDFEIIYHLSKAIWAYIHSPNPEDEIYQALRTHLLNAPKEKSVVTGKN